MIKEYYTILSGDYESLHNQFEGIVCRLNGIKFFDMRLKAERSSIGKVVEEVLRSGDNILCSMEAAWNLSPNIPVTELFEGMIKVAINSNAVIVPVGIERFHRKLYGINVGIKLFDSLLYIGKYPTEKEMLAVAKDDLRHEMVDLKMQLYFHEKIESGITVPRKAIGEYEEYNKWFKKDILKGWTFTEDAIKAKRYHSKNEPVTVFSCLIKRFDNLSTLHEMMSDTSILEVDRIRAEKQYKDLLVELSREIRNSIYPNEIRGEMLKIFNKMT